MILTSRENTEEIIQRIRSEKACLPIFCTGSHWNTEAILMAAKNIGEKYNIEKVPVSVAITYNYEYMPQAQRITHTNDARLGFISIMKHLQVLADDPKSPYYSVRVLPHLDHANPSRDKWALTSGTDYLASVMFDAQQYPLDENVRMTAEYVKNYKDKVMIEGIMDDLGVFGKHEKKTGKSDLYPQRAYEYVKKTGIDFLVADLGTEQQSDEVGKKVYLKQRARHIHELFEDRLLVLHGTSCLSDNEISTLPDDGVLRVNMWTRIARESGLFAYHQLLNRKEKINMNDFNSIESYQYLMDSTRKATEIMEGIMLSLGYKNLAK